jgi:hypothetical protein
MSPKFLLAAIMLLGPAGTAQQPPEFMSRRITYPTGPAEPDVICLEGHVRTPAWGWRYYRADQYMTARKYDISKVDILGSDKTEILARVRRVRAAERRR